MSTDIRKLAVLTPRTAEPATGVRSSGAHRREGSGHVGSHEEGVGSVAFAAHENVAPRREKAMESSKGRSKIEMTVVCATVLEEWIIRNGDRALITKHAIIFANYDAGLYLRDGVENPVVITVDVD